MVLRGIENTSKIEYMQTGALADNRIDNGRIRTEIVVVNPITMDNAEITLPKNSKINAIPTKIKRKID